MGEGVAELGSKHKVQVSLFLLGQFAVRMLYTDTM